MQTVSSDSVVQTLLSQGTWDLAFIDGDHSYSACLADFELVRSAGVRVIALHDIVDAGAPDVRRVWEKIRREHVDAYEFKEFIEQYPDVTEWTQTTHCGIGVAVAMS